MLRHLTCVGISVVGKLYTNLYFTTMKSDYFVLHENCSLYLRIYVICDCGDQILCESIIIDCTT
jgi:hypothetical protein